MPKEKRRVGAPTKTEEEKVNSVTKCITFEKDTFEKLEELREDDPKSLFINKLINEEYLRV